MQNAARMMSFSMVLLATPASSAQSCPDIDHSHQAWSDLLKAHVHKGFVSYGALASKRSALDSYLDSLAKTCVERYRGWGKANQLAFWLNAYNAHTVRLILDHYPTPSIRKIAPDPDAPFKDKRIPIAIVGSQPKSLNQIEHDIIRPQFNDARIHAALVCAAKSCPSLRAEAFRGKNLEQQLNSQMRIFLANTQLNRVKDNHIELSEIFDWFRSDFEKNGGGLYATLQRYGPPSLAQKAKDQAPIRFLPYDWSLNGR